MKARLSLISFLSIMLLAMPSQQIFAQSAGGHVKMEKCPTCGKPKQNCPYKGNHPKCQICGKVKEQCQYKGKHPKCQTCGKVVEQCQYKGDHPKCQTCGKIIEDCPYNGDHPKPQPITGTLSITSSPSDAVVKIDGEYMGTTPLTLKNRNSGTYKVTFSAEGYETTIQSVTVTADKITTCRATLKKKKIDSSASNEESDIESNLVEQTIAPVVFDEGVEFLGAILKYDTIKRKNTLYNGLIIKELRSGKFKKAGMPIGFQIQKVNDKNISTIDDLRLIAEEVSRSKDPTLWIKGLNQNGKKLTFVVSLED